MNVSPVADENFWFYSCSSESIARFHFYSGSKFLPKPVLPNLVDPDFAEGANLIYLPLPSLPGLPILLGEDVVISSLASLSYSS